MENLITQAIARHEAAHLVIAHLLCGPGAIEMLQFSSHRKIPSTCIANCKMGKWFSQGQCIHLSIPTLMAGVIADLAAGTPLIHSEEDLRTIAARSIYIEIEGLYDVAAAVVRVLTSPQIESVLDSLADFILLRGRSGAKSIRGSTLHSIIAMSIGRTFRFKRPSKIHFKVRQKGPVKWEEMREIRLIYYQISKAWREVAISTKEKR